jgi:hypothetical protein
MQRNGDRRYRLIDQTLRPLKATVEVSFEVNGVIHTVRCDSENGDLLIKVGHEDVRAYIHPIFSSHGAPPPCVTHALDCRETAHWC